MRVFFLLIRYMRIHRDRCYNTITLNRGKDERVHASTAVKIDHALDIAAVPVFVASHNVH